MEQIIDRYGLLKRTIERLSVIHDTDKNITTGKNKLLFTVNGEQFELIKSVDKLTGSKKTILEGVNNTMKPVILYQDDSDRFTDNDIAVLTMNLDRYFVSETLKFPGKYAICNSYYYTRPLLEALGLDLTYLYGCAADEKQQKSEAIILLFIAEDKISGEKSVAVFIIKDDCIEILRFRLKDKNTISLRIDGSSDCESYELKYAGNTPEMLKNSVEMLIADFDRLVPASGEISFLGEQ